MEWIFVLITLLAVILFWYGLKNKFGDPDQVESGLHNETLFDENDDDK